LPRSPRLAIAVVIIVAVASAAAQPPDRIATTAHALVTNPLFFNGKRIVVRHALKATGTLTELEATVKPVYVFWKEPPKGSSGEIRGEFFDLGRMQDGDQRFAAFDFRAVVEAANNGRWPGRDQIFVILGATFVESPPPPAPTIRAIALTPEQFDNRSVTLVGRFKGRNLYADLPQGVAKSKWDFILQSADAAIWVTGIRPKGKDFDLDPGARVDTGRWLEVTGVVHRDGGALWIAGESVRRAAAPADEPIEIAAPVVVAEPAPSVIFSAPLADDTDVPVAGPVRIQFSRDMDAKSFNNRVRVRYSGRDAPVAPPPPATLTYNDGTRALEIRFKGPLERFQVVTIQLEEGITAIDGQPLRPWTLTFTTGG
jgi:hypothetical protein